MRRGVGLALCIVFLAPLMAFAQPRPPAPELPAKYQVTLRYRIASARNLHVPAYDKLIADLQALKFEFQPPLDEYPESDREDTTKNYLKGLLPSGNIAQLLLQPSIANVQIAGDEVKIPDAPEMTVRVRLELAGDLETKEQKDLSDQTRLMLGLIGFREAAGYDHRGMSGRPYTRIVGQVSVGTLELLLKDLRLQPAGWLEPKFVLEKLPAPLREVNPIKLVEVLNDSEPLETVKDAVPIGGTLTKVGDFLTLFGEGPAFKVTPDLWEAMLDKKDDMVRVQVVFAGEPTIDTIRRDLATAASTFQYEGHLGNVASGLIPAGQIPVLATNPRISVIRKPRVGLPDVYPGTKAPVELKAVMKQTGLDTLHAVKATGKGVRIGILDRDFRHWDKYVANKLLPARTTLVDLTAERSPDIQPLPPMPDDVPGHGTLCALAAAQAAPDAEIVLIRIEPTDPYQIVEVLGYFKGERFSDTLLRRFDELQLARAELISKRRVLAIERQVFLKQFPDERELEEEDSFSFLGPAFGWVFSPRDLHRQKMAQQDKLELAHAQRENRYRQLLDDVRTLVGVQMLANPFTWNDGFPLGGSSPLTRWFESRFAKAPLFFQSAGNIRGQTWTSLYSDANKNGVMEFAPSSTPLPKDRWSRELNFISWSPYNGMRVTDIPDKTKLRLSLQWREPHESEYFSTGDDDVYRTPLVNLRIVLLRQRDPDGKTLPADAFELVARTTVWPQRIQHLPGGSVYEHVLDVPLEKAGHYAVRIERQLDYAWMIEGLESETVRPQFVLKRGLNPTGLRPTSAPTLPVLEKNWEFRPRLFVEAIDDDSRLKGRPQFADFATDQGSLGIPADSRGLFAISAMDLKNRTLPYAVVGTPPYLDLAKQHLIFVPDQIAEGMGAAYGTTLSNSFATGIAACLLSRGITSSEVQSLFRQHQGYGLHVAPK